MSFLFIALGGGLGAVGRFLVVELVQRLSGISWPLGTLTVNWIGSFAIGGLAVLFTGPWVARDEWRLLLLTGVLGGFTTFSAYSLESLRMMQDGQLGRMLAYVLLSNVGGLAAVLLGWWAGEWVTRS